VNVRTLSVHVNPEWLDAASYLGLLNRAFPGQWSRAAYDWYIARPFGGVTTDILVLTAGKRLLAGMALCHREAIVGSRDRSGVRVICAAATLPDQRGRGHYGRLLIAAREHCIVQGYVALLAFVTRDNISARGLLNRGAHAIPSFYITSAWRRPWNPTPPVSPRFKPASRLAADGRTRISAAMPALAGHCGECVDGGAFAGASRARDARFYYESVDDWRRQFIDRPHDVRSIRLGHDCTALVETVGCTDRLQWLECPHGKASRCVGALAKASAAAGHGFFMYTLDPLLAAAARRARLRTRHGYFMLWATGHRAHEWDALVNASWRLQSGDRV
jgi:GNAT superfamily N-acetyltransferase